MVVDEDMNILPSISSLFSRARVRLASAITGDAVTGSVKATKLFDVEMNELTRHSAFIAPHRFGQFQVLKPRHVGPFQDTADGGGRDPGRARDVLAGETLAP